MLGLQVIHLGVRACLPKTHSGQRRYLFMTTQCRCRRPLQRHRALCTQDVSCFTSCCQIICCIPSDLQPLMWALCTQDMSYVTSCCQIFCCILLIAADDVGSMYSGHELRHLLLSDHLLHPSDLQPLM